MVVVVVVGLVMARVVISTGGGGAVVSLVVLMATWPVRGGRILWDGMMFVGICVAAVVSRTRRPSLDGGPTSVIKTCCVALPVGSSYRR